MPAMERNVRICHAGRVDYVHAARLQRSLRAAREVGEVEDLLLVLEHDPVVTCGTRTEPSDVRLVRDAGLPLVAVERGGKATWHGPGQVVVYPIFGIDVVNGDVPELVRRLEQALIDTLVDCGLEAARRPGLPGVWVGGDRKIASVGLRLTRGVTFHGVALNVSCDLSGFSSFTPCGITGAQMTSIAHELALPPAAASRALQRAARVLPAAIARRFQLAALPIERPELDRVAQRFPVADPELCLPPDVAHSEARHVVVAR